jgi:hypothetical protein
MYSTFLKLISIGLKITSKLEYRQNVFQFDRCREVLKAPTTGEIQKKGFLDSPIQVKFLQKSKPSKLL